MSDDQDTQTDLDAAQVDLETKIGQLKALVMDKVETVERPFAWLRDHAWLIAIGAGLGLVLLSMRGRED